MIPNSIKSIQDSPFFKQVKLDSGLEFETRLVVGSDGANSIVKSESHINSYGWSYN